ncbi:hypothetical protein ACFE04_023570 [Oxalis oulophora]
MAAAAKAARNRLMTTSKPKARDPPSFKWRPKSITGKPNPTPPSTSNLGKFLGIPPPSLSETSTLISKFIKLNNKQNPGMKKNNLTEDKLKTMLAGKDQVGIPEIVKMLNNQLCFLFLSHVVKRPRDVQESGCRRLNFVLFRLGKDRALATLLVATKTNSKQPWTLYF